MARGGADAAEEGADELPYGHGDPYRELLAVRHAECMNMRTWEIAWHNAGGDNKQHSPRTFFFTADVRLWRQRRWLSAGLRREWRPVAIIVHRGNGMRSVAIVTTCFVREACLRGVTQL